MDRLAAWGVGKVAEGRRRAEGRRPKASGSSAGCCSRLFSGHRDSIGYQLAAEIGKGSRRRASKALLRIPICNCYKSSAKSTLLLYGLARALLRCHSPDWRDDVLKVFGFAAVLASGVAISAVPAFALRTVVTQVEKNSNGSM